MTSIPISSGPGLCWNGRDVTGEKSVGDDDMNSKGAASGAKSDARRELRVGVIGAGVMGSNHARVLAGLPDVTLVGIVDPLPEHRARAVEMVGCRAFASLEELFDEGIDAVTIAAPTHLHHEIALACITRNIHLLVEKPVASTVEEGEDIVSAARGAGVTLMVGHVERFNPAVVAIKQAISCRARSRNVSASSPTAAIRCAICRSATTNRCAPS